MRSLYGSLLCAAVIFSLLFLPVMPVLAAHPLITDDTGTQGKGRFQIEVNGEYGYEREDGVTERSYELGTTVSYGITDTMDLVAGIPYQIVRFSEKSSTVQENGISDVSCEMKWRFFDHEGLSFALKPGITLPAGDDERGLGSGRMTYRMSLIGTKESEPWEFHGNVGYIGNENRAGDRRTLWHASVATAYEPVKGLKLVANTGLETNPDRASDTHPAFLLGGVIYSVSENLDIDFGVKAGLNRPETDYAVLAGIAFRL